VARLQCARDGPTVKTSAVRVEAGLLSESADGRQVVAGSRLVAAVRQRLSEAADPARAPQMQSYMKSALPFLGVPVPEVRALTKQCARTQPPASVTELAAAARTLWREATHREQRYAATELTGLRLAAGSLQLLPLYEEMIVTGAWWDHTDAVARRVGELLTAHAERVRPLVLAWSRSPDRWLRRVSIIAQLGAGPRTDLGLLVDVIDASATHRDFFVRKAIGWALRDYARTDPDWVHQFVTTRADVLSALSQREATRRLVRRR
jgi:3-methyladenine DNA glycosylase AlkD